MDDGSEFREGTEEDNIVGADSGEETTRLELAGASVVNVVNICTEDSSGQGKKSAPSPSPEIDHTCHGGNNALILY